MKNVQLTRREIQRTGSMPGTIFWCVAASVFAILSSARLASAESSAVDTCVNETNPKLEIGACTRVIAVWGTANPAIAWAFYHRGNGFTAALDYDSAIADYDSSIALNPRFAHAYGDRGLAYFGKGEYQRAVQDPSPAAR
jgi:tetratricopeptide (TPR) repeat protein